MSDYVNGETIKKLRKERNLTQQELADMLFVSNKAVSKWENNKGYPDSSLLYPLSKAFKVSLSELMTGEIVKNNNVSANLSMSKIYVCPICGNVVRAIGEASISCCGINLIADVPIEAKDEIIVENIEDEMYVKINHPMTKDDYISFISFVADNKEEFVKLYPESEATARFKLRRSGYIFYYSNKEGLQFKKIG